MGKRCDGEARLAQSVEHETLNLGVVGSSPTSGVLLRRAHTQRHINSRSYWMTRAISFVPLDVCARDDYLLAASSTHLN